MTNDPQADNARAAFIESLAAHLDHFGARERDVNTGPVPDGEQSGLDGEPAGPDAEPAGLDGESAGPDGEQGGPDGEPDWQRTLGGITAALSAPASWSEPPDVRSALLLRVRAQAERANGAALAPKPEREPLTAVTPAPDLAEPEVEPEQAGPELSGPTLAEPVPPGSERARPELSGLTSAEPESGEPRIATVTPLRPRWQRLAYAVPVAAAAAAILTLAVLGVQRALTPGPDEIFTALGAGDLQAKVTVTSKPSGFEITLDSKDLPAAPAGSYYAAWLRRGPGAGDVVPIGTFHGRRVGDPILLWSGVDPAEYRTFSVTLQRDGEPPVPNAPSAHRVLLGTVNG
ncbi:MAG TPA: anti-sigma factor [Kineosporiaceae bacterium]|nr:anti-sigma factor [Kineosporiaceae bacterium]